MADRPKSDLASLATFGVGLYGTKKVGNLEKVFRQHLISQQENHRELMHGLRTISELQVASLYMLREVNEKLSNLSEIAWDISNHLRQKAQKDEFVGDLKILVRSINKALDEIDLLAESNLEYAKLQVEILQDLAREHDLKIEHFKDLSMADLDYVEGVLDRLDSTFNDYSQRLGSLDEYRLLKDSLISAMNIEAEDVPQSKVEINDLLMAIRESEKKVKGLEESLKSLEKANPMNTDEYQKKKQELYDEKKRKKEWLPDERGDPYIETGATFIVLYTILMGLSYAVFGDDSNRTFWLGMSYFAWFFVSLMAAIAVRISIVDGRIKTRNKQMDEISKIGNQIGKLEARFSRQGSSGLKIQKNKLLSEVKINKKNYASQKISLAEKEAKLVSLMVKKEDLLKNIAHLIPLSSELEP